MTPAGAPTARRLTLPTHDVELLEWGPADGDLVVALHGFPDTAWSWRRVAPLLAEAGYRVAAPFLRGYAPSGIPHDGDYSVRALAADACELHARLGGGPRTALVGHDWGAITAGVIAADPASPYTRAALLAVPPLGWMNPTRATLPHWLGAVARQPFRSWYIGYNQVPGLAERRFHRLAARLWRRWSPGYDATADLARLAGAVPDREHARAVVSYYRPPYSSAAREALAEPRIPVLSLQGDRDGALDPGFFPAVRAHAEAPSHAELVRDAGHFLQLERPREVADRLLSFLRDGSVRTGAARPGPRAARSPG